MFRLLVASLAFALPASASFLNVPLTAGASSQPHESIWNIGETLTDTFTYTPDDPTAATPEQAQRGPSDTPAWFVPGFHGNEQVALHFLQYSFAPITTTAGAATFAVDLWGRSTPSSIWGRDDNYVITLYNGGFTAGQAVAASPLTSIAPVAPYQQRTTFDLPAGVTFDRFEVRAENNPAFTIMETRAALSTVASAQTYAAFAAAQGWGAADGDDDGDGFPNLLEFAGGTDGKSAASWPAVTSSRPGTGFQLQFTRRTNVSGVTLALRTSGTSLASWNTVAQAPESVVAQAGGLELVTYLIPLTSVKGFFRVEALVP
jgi:hypothetical protein